MVVIGVGAYVLSERKNGTVAYHQERYRAIYNDGRATRIEKIICVSDPGDCNLPIWKTNGDGLDSHRRAMVRHGYLVEKEFVLSFRPAREVAQRVRFTKCLPTATMGSRTGRWMRSPQTRL